MRTFICFTLFIGALAAPGRRPLYVRGKAGIVGGVAATQGEFPYQLSFQDTSYIRPFHFCGASIYDENTAITAGHCVRDDDFDNPQNLQVVAGELSLKTESGDEQVAIVSKIILHENFHSDLLYNDIALLKFETPLKYNENVGPIALPSQRQETPEGEICTVTGWGTLSYGGNTSDVLQKVNVPVVSDKDCRSSYGPISVADSMICAGEKGKDSCQGDSGGPMVLDGQLVGIVSWGRGCAFEGYPGVYTQVSYFVDWITSHA